MPEQTPLARFLAERGHGALLEARPLEGDVTLPGGGAAPAWLCRAEGGLFVAGVAGEPGVAHDLGRDGVRLQGRMLGAKLEVAGQAYSLGRREAEEVRRWIALARLAAGSAHPVQDPPSGPWIEPGSELEERWLAGALPSGDAVIAWLPTAEDAEMDSPVLGPVKAPRRLLLAGERACLVAVSAAGDAAVVELPLAPLELEANSVRKDEAAVGGVRWKLPRGGAEKLRGVQALFPLPRAGRLREGARLLARAGEVAQARRLLTALASAEPLDELALRRLGGSDEYAEEDAIDALIAAERDGDALARWVGDWAVPPAEARLLLARVLAKLPTPEAARWALPLHQEIRDQQLAYERDPFVQAEVDLELAEHLLFAGKNAEAAALLEARRASLPSEDLHAVLPPEGARLTDGEGGQPLHIRALELLVQARGEPDVPDAGALASLARHQPLVPARLADLGEVGGPLGEKARKIGGLMLPNGLAAGEDGPEGDAPTRALSAEQIEALRHPVARQNGALGRLQATLARVVPPDQGTIRDYCEQVTVRRHPEVIAAIADTCVALGLPAVPAFVSLGKRRIGIRSFEKPDPYLLIGGDHLDEAAEGRLSRAELRAAIAAELAHLRFQHSRVTSTDLWAGIWDKSAAALETTALVLPMLKYLPVDLIGQERAYRAVSRVIPHDWLRRVYAVEDAGALAGAVAEDLGKLGAAGSSAASDAAGRLVAARAAAGRLVPAKAEGRDLGLDSARVLAAHRAMQLTADRAGLLLTGDPRAAIRAMFLVHSHLIPELHIAERAGLHAALSRQDAAGRHLLPDLTVRIAALIAFYLSDEYEGLRAALR